MELDRFLNLLASTFGAMGSVYVLKALAALSPNLIERLSRTYYDFSVAQIDSLTSQKADSIVGIALVGFAFVVAVVNYAAVPSGVRIFERRGVAIAMVAALSGVAYVALAVVGSGVQRHQRLAVGRIITAQALNDLFDRGQVRDYDIPSLRVHARDLLALQVNDNETARSLVQRLANEVGATVPTTLDFSQVEPKPEQ